MQFYQVDDKVLLHQVDEFHVGKLDEKPTFNGPVHEMCLKGLFRIDFFWGETPPEMKALAQQKTIHVSFQKKMQPTKFGRKKTHFWGL